MARDFCSALGTGSVGIQVPMSEVVPVTSDQQGFALGAVGGISFGIMDISNVDMMDSIFPGDVSGSS